MADELLPGVSMEEIEAAIRESAAVRAEKLSVAKEMVAAAKQRSPIDHGDYVAAWRVRRRTTGGDTHIAVVNSNFKAHLIEDGTATIKEHAVAAKTAIEFGGTAGDVLSGPDV